MEYQVASEVFSAWHHHSPIDGEGRPTTKFSLGLLKHFYRNRDTFHDLEDLAEERYAHPELVKVICNHLCLIGILEKEEPGSQRYRYNLNCSNVELQGKVESFLVTPETMPDRIYHQTLLEFPPEMRLPPHEFLLARMEESSD